MQEGNMLRKLSLAFMAALFVGACKGATGPDLMFYNPDGESDEVTFEAALPGDGAVFAEDHEVGNDLDGSF
jgi:hypothetical protein